jgi:hypothetical protein
MPLRSTSLGAANAGKRHPAIGFGELHQYKSRVVPATFSTTLGFGLYSGSLRGRIFSLTVVQKLGQVNTTRQRRSYCSYFLILKEILDNSRSTGPILSAAGLMNILASDFANFPALG